MKIKGSKSLSFLGAIALTTVNAVSAQQIYPISPQNYQENGSINIFVPPPETNQNLICNTFLEPSINRIVDNYQGKWGILVQKLADGEIIYQYNADLALIPASNAKILTTAAALQKLSPETTIRANKSLREWINVTNLRSNNFYADTLLKYIGGYKVVQQELVRLGVNPNSFYLADGSGLSRRNVATPRALVDTLTAMYSTPNRNIFLASLPTAGISGTLRNRMKQTPAQGTVHAKTGTLKGVRALSGYMEHPSYGTLVFSIIVNQPNQSGDSLVRAIDEIVLNLNMTSACE